MTGPVVRPPLTVVLRRFWRLAFRSQGPGFKFAALLSTAVLITGIGTAVVGVGGNDTSRLHQATGPGADGAGNGVGPSASAAPSSAANGNTAGNTGNGNGPGTGSNGTGTKSTPGCQNAAGKTDHGVTASKVTVVIPIPNLGSVQQAFAFGSNFSSEDAKSSADSFVKDINAHGGINCRLIEAKYDEYDPTNDTSMRTLCKKYTVDQPAFAFIDILGAWHDNHQLCVAQEGHTPLISPWTTTTSFLHTGVPNLWWTGPDLCNVLRNLVSWAVSSHALTSSTRFGVVYTDSDADQAGYDQCLKPALAKAHLTPTDVAKMHYSTTPDQSSSEGPVFASRFHSKRIKVVIPLLPFFQFVAWIQGEQAQRYAPRLLLSDYDSSFQIALGLVGESGTGNRPFPTPYTAQLQDQDGPTYYVLGNHDYPAYASPLGATCDKIWLHYNPPTKDKKHIEATGTAMTACQNIELFKTAAAKAGNVLTRTAFDAQMARLTNFNGGTIPNLRFGNAVSAGPHLTRIVRVHNNTNDACPKKIDGGNQGNCWLVEGGWHEQSLAAI
jgi:hypothetical protein